MLQNVSDIYATNAPTDPNIELERAEASFLQENATPSTLHTVIFYQTLEMKRYIFRTQLAPLIGDSDNMR